VRQALEIRGEVRWGRLTVVDEGMALLGSQLLRHGLGIQRSGEGGLFWPTVGVRCSDRERYIWMPVSLTEVYKTWSILILFKSHDVLASDSQLFWAALTFHVAFRYLS
jgi:hypothetical protein